jgi:DNA-binding CsgD family transcriptional regulator
MARRTSLPGGGPSSAIRALCQRTLTSRALRSELRAPLRRLLAFDAYCVNTCDVATGVVTSSVGDGLSPEHAQALFALEATGQDINSLRDLYQGSKDVCTIGQSTGGKPEHSERMRKIFLPLGYADELRAALRFDRVCFGYLHLFRRAERPAFSRTEVEQVARLAPMVAAALRRAAVRETAHTQGSPPPAPGLMLLDAHNQLVQQSKDMPLASLSVDALEMQSGLAHVLLDLASRARTSSPSRATLLQDRSSPRSLAAVQLGDQTAVVVDQLSADAARALLATLAALTPRERTVSDCMARGDSNSAIAATLGITLYTVKDHVKAVLAKTRCRNRAELAARWSGSS